ncbi:hypothetical protein [Modestobacter marinus]|uniref:Uncharacterized protein n=1 Tax=Modestobacter marinus TaxID=477641 RepID=A0A846LNZ6_9ACTN|nr:hypothetical protein [Modestobacter marinus]NIH69286.1 hypothetical protein [Modestobacter marinus]
MCVLFDHRHPDWSLPHALVCWTRLDPVAGCIIAAFAIHQGREAWEGELVEDDD